jgi:hypothetical protein
MKKNIGVTDRVVRVIVGLLLLSLFASDGWVMWLGLAGVAVIATGIVGMCPAYRVLGFSTIERRGKTA